MYHFFEESWTPLLPCAGGSIRAKANLPIKLRNGRFVDANLVAFHGINHVALVFDRPHALSSTTPTLVRVHSRCVTSESFGSRRCDCAQQLDLALERLADEGGVLVYMDDEGRGIGLAAKVHAYQMQDNGLDTFEANVAIGCRRDERCFGMAGTMLNTLGIKSVRLITQNVQKSEALKVRGIDVVELVSEPIDADVLCESGRRYLQAKAMARHVYSQTQQGPEAFA